MWLRWGGPLTASESQTPEALGARTAARVLLRLLLRRFYLVVVAALHPGHTDRQSRAKLLLKAALLPGSRRPRLVGALGRLVLGRTRCVILDISDTRAAYFKRELELPQAGRDPWLRPTGLFIPEAARRPAAFIKDTDVFFAGWLCNAARRWAMQDLCVLQAAGYRIHLPDDPLPYPAYLEAIARAWLVVSPDGFGWDCYRHYEADFASFVALTSRPAYPRALPLRHGVHCFHYEPGPGALLGAIPALLVDKPRLERMAAAAQARVLAHHTRARVAERILAESFRDRSGTIPKRTRVSARGPRAPALSRD
ncbi:hypothetical protein DK427_07845 [Methylobacterium radiodurans]|uniref:Glycosyltransferase family 1 protein n=2 Tax=Methylobacterium radiodurans TaxID=2202828 RepID=A0A2U8VPW5_9HYPH|nr:hypothetical protein DK427_07845 [Methylobacterium radiodurans]